MLKVQTFGLAGCGTLHFENLKCARTHPPTVWRCGGLKEKNIVVVGARVLAGGKVPSPGKAELCTM